MIPELMDGVLPAGIHLCTLDEVEMTFGRFQRSNRRIQLTERLKQYVKAARSSGLVKALVVNGSYVTAKEEPDDIDLIVVLRPGATTAGTLRPFEYNVISRRAVRRDYRFDILVAEDGSEEYARQVAFFSRIALKGSDFQTRQTTKGLLRIEL
jgi:hypothetical protein